MVWKAERTAPAFERAGNGETLRRLTIPGICGDNKANSSGPGYRGGEPGLFQGYGRSGTGVRKNSGRGLWSFPSGKGCLRMRS